MPTSHKNSKKTQKALRKNIDKQGSTSTQNRHKNTKKNTQKNDKTCEQIITFFVFFGFVEDIWGVSAQGARLRTSKTTKKTLKMTHNIAQQNIKL